VILRRSIDSVNRERRVVAVAPKLDSSAVLPSVGAERSVRCSEVVRREMGQ
jgi:hypothetical protein